MGDLRARLRRVEERLGRESAPSWEEAMDAELIAHLDRLAERKARAEDVSEDISRLYEGSGDE